MTQHVDAKTMPDFFGKRFDSVPLKVTASVIVFIFLIPYTASLYNGLSSLFGLVLYSVLACYFNYGGTDWILCYFRWIHGNGDQCFIQGIIMLFGICAVIGAVLADNGGFQEATKALASVTGDAGWQGAYTAFLGRIRWRFYLW